MMAGIQADIWILTETRSHLSPGSGFNCRAFSSDSGDRSPGECWVAIWARDAITGSAIETSEAKRSACASLKLPSGDTLIVYGTVLPWLGDRSQLPKRGADAFLSTLSIHSEDWRRLRSEHPNALICVAGDFNQDLLLTGHYYGSARGRAALWSTLRNSGLTCVTGGSADPVAAKFSPRACIDHFCISDSWADTEPILSLNCWPSPAALGSKLTDHHGIAIKCAIRL